MAWLLKADTGDTAMAAGKRQKERSGDVTQEDRTDERLCTF